MILEIKLQWSRAMTTHEAKSGVGSRTAVKVITFLSLTKWSIFLSRCYCECSDCVWSESQKCRVSKRLQLIMRVKWFKHLHSELNRKCDGDCELRLSSPALRVIRLWSINRPSGRIWATDFRPLGDHILHCLAGEYELSAPFCANYLPVYPVSRVQTQKPDLCA